MMPPKNKKEVRKFIDLVKYYSDMWAWGSHLLHILTSLTSPKLKFKWTDMEHKAFDGIKRTVAHDILLAYLDFNKRFDIHKNASDYQVASVISHNGKTIDLYSLKLTETKTRYAVREKEFLSILETLKEFCMISIGQQLKIFADLKNITCIKFNTDCVLRWRLILE